MVATSELADKLIVITGARGGIGCATARLCHEAGARLILLDIATPETVASRLGALASIAVIHQVDSTDRSEVERIAREIGPVYGVVDTAALCPAGDWLEPGWDDVLERTLAVNIKGPINVTRAFFPGMVERGEGRIVLCGSVAGWMGGILSGPDYAFTKGGIHAFVRWLSRRGAPHNVLVNGVAPGATDTGMIQGKGYNSESLPLRRFADPEEIAGAIVFLLGKGGSYMSGSILDVNGGVYFH
jgi:NAD(P)-dependent dehydrogenase (short-subunit alcohol dehydrogenase family)